MVLSKLSVKKNNGLRREYSGGWSDNYHNTSPSGTWGGDLECICGHILDFHIEYDWETGGGLKPLGSCNGTEVIDGIKCECKGFTDDEFLSEIENVRCGEDE